MKKMITLFAVTVSVLVLALAPAAQAAPVVTPGDGYTGPYRLAFVTSGSTIPASQDISTYNSFVTAAAAAVTELNALGVTWNCLGSTQPVSAKVNTGTDSTGDANDVPIYTTTGERIANNNADLWDGTILAGIHYDDGTEAGNGGSIQKQTWTGTNADGSPATGDGGPLGYPNPTYFRLARGGYTDGNWISGPSDHVGQSKHLMALSDPIIPPTTDGPLIYAR